MSNKIQINEVIAKYPLVGEFLNKNGVECTTCSVATCLLEDVLEIHNFSNEDQSKMKNHINLLIDNKTNEMPLFTPLTKKKNYSNIVEVLIEEHRLISELIYIAEYIVNKKDFLNKFAQQLEKIVYYLEYYADDFHHKKEEDVLFCLFETNDIINAMLQEHEQGRKLRVLLANSNDELEIKKIILEYVEMLKDHIYKEDNILFPYLDRQLNQKQIDITNDKLLQIDTSINNELKLFIDEFNEKLFTR